MSTLIEEDETEETAVHSDPRWENWQGEKVESSKITYGLGPT